MKQSDQTYRTLDRTRTSGAVGVVLTCAGALASLVCLTKLGATNACLPGIAIALIGVYMKYHAVRFERVLRDSLARELAYEHRHGVR